jgi:hypothetical protein
MDFFPFQLLITSAVIFGEHMSLTDDANLQEQARRIKKKRAPARWNVASKVVDDEGCGVKGVRVSGQRAEGPAEAVDGQ